MATGIINPKFLDQAFAQELSNSYLNAKPCKYLVMEDFFTEEIANELFDNFPPIQD